MNAWCRGMVNWCFESGRGVSEEVIASEAREIDAGLDTEVHSRFKEIAGEGPSPRLEAN